MHKIHILVTGSSKLESPQIGNTQKKM